ncbi:MAG: hypothetical protein ACT4OP_10880 [Actinomycetota bacterium]
MADPRGSRRIRPSPFQVIPLVVGVAAVAALWSQAGRVTPTTSAPPMTLSGPTESATTVAPDQGNLVTWAGTLPDGTDYWITSSQFEGSTRRSAAILADLGLAPSLLLGVTGFMPGFNAVGPTEVRDGIVEAPAGAWVISIELSANAIAALGPQAESILAESIRGHTSLFGDPVVDLAWPLRLAAGSEAAQTHYRSFLVRRCNLYSVVVCSDDVVAFPMSYVGARRTSVNPELKA